MDHHSAGGANSDSDSALRDTILPFCTDATVDDALTVLGQLVCNGRAFENTVVCVVGVYLNAELSRDAREVVRGIDGVSGVEGDLMLGVEVTGGCVTEDSGAAELVVGGFLSSGVQLVASDSRFQLITEDAVTGRELASLETSSSLWGFGSSGGLVMNADLSAVLAGSTDGNVWIVVTKETQGKLV